MTLTKRYDVILRYTLRVNKLLLHTLNIPSTLIKHLERI